MNDGIYKYFLFYENVMSSISKVSSIFLPIRPGKPFSPYAKLGGIVSFALSPIES